MLTTDLIVEELRALSAKVDRLLSKPNQTDEFWRWLSVVSAVGMGWLMGHY